MGMSPGRCRALKKHPRRRVRKKWQRVFGIWRINHGVAPPTARQILDEVRECQLWFNLKLSPRCLRQTARALSKMGYRVRWTPPAKV